MTTPYTLPEPYYKHGSGDIQSYGAAQLHAAFAAGAASRDGEIEALHAEIQRQYACISSHAEITQKAEAEVEALRAACNHYEAALLAAFPKGASEPVFEHWNNARIAITKESAK